MIREPKQDRSRATRRRLLDATLTMLSTRGMAATTVGAVAELADVSRGAAQHHFPTREVLIQESLEHFFSERTQQLRGAVAGLGAGPRGAPVRDVVELVIGFYRNELFHAAVHVWAAAASDAGLAEVIRPAEARYSREVYQLAALALDADLSDQRTRRLLAAVLDAARGLGLASVLVDDPAHVERAVETWTGILDGIRRRAG